MMKEKIYSLWTTGQGLYILLTLLFLGIFISPLSLVGSVISNIIVECIFAVILITGIFTIPCSIILRFGMMFITFFAVIARVLDKLDHSNFTIETTNNILAAINLIAFSILIVKHFLIDKAKLRHRIAAAVAVYLIFGVFWARLYDVVYLFNPTAFSINEKITQFTLTYFSFTTLATLGYGDIVPLSTLARSLSILEGVTGQLYLVILISSLVSEFSAARIKSSKEETDY